MNDDELDPQFVQEMAEAGVAAQMAEASHALYQMHTALLKGGFSRTDAAMMLAAYLMLTMNSTEGDQ